MDRIGDQPKIGGATEHIKLDLKDFFFYSSWSNNMVTRPFALTIIKTFLSDYHFPTPLYFSETGFIDLVPPEREYSWRMGNELSPWS